MRVIAVKKIIRQLHFLPFQRSFMSNAKQVNTIVDTPNGKLKGSFLSSFWGEDYYSFKGIPYAKPPTGALRFKDPEPIEPWSGIRETTQHSPISLQVEAAKKVVGSEDCLYANVYTKSLDGNKKAPVMVWFHWGGFLFGNGNDDLYGPDHLLTKDVVLVTFNYRLGVFGFLNLDHEIAPGNQGLKDQIMLLNWVKKNISQFGGDPDNVTIFGCSSGGVSVHYLTMSPLAKGLYHKAICQSSNALTSWAIQEETEKKTFEFLRKLGCEKKTNAKATVDFLNRFDSLQLFVAQEKCSTPKKWLDFVFPFGPSVDDKSNKPFMPVHPSLVVEKGISVPFMQGYNSFEGRLFLTYMQHINVDHINKNLEKYCHPLLLQTLSNKYNCTLEDMKYIYFDGEAISEHNKDKFVRFLGDFAFAECSHRLAKIQIRNKLSPTYFYKFLFCDTEHLGSEKWANPKANGKLSVGATHGDEQFYLFKPKKIADSKANNVADRVTKQMVELWTNFARTGNPTPVISELTPVNWEPLKNNDDGQFNYLSIDSDIKMKKMPSFQQIYASKTDERNANNLYPPDPWISLPFATEEETETTEV